MRLRFTPEAARELERVLTFVAEHSPQAARRVHTRIRKTIDLLIEHPYSGRPTSRRDLRRIVATPYPYVIFYRVVDSQVVIIAVRHGARDPESMPGQPQR